MDTVYHAADYAELRRAQYLYQTVKNKTLTGIPHRHDFYEIVFLLAGSALHCCNKEKQPLTAGGFCILSPADEHYFCSQSEDAEVFSLSLPQERTNALTAALETAPRCGEVLRLADEEAVQTIRGLPLLADGERRLALNRLACRFFTAAAPAQSGRGAPQFLRDALRQACTPPLIGGGVAAFAACAGYSHAQLCRLTAKHFGKTPQQLLHEERMRIIREYLQTTDRTLEDIACDAGYRSQSQFYLAVKKYFGCTPAQLRRRAAYPL